MGPQRKGVTARFDGGVIDGSLQRGTRENTSNVIPCIMQVSAVLCSYLVLWIQLGFLQSIAVEAAGAGGFKRGSGEQVMAAQWEEGTAMNIWVRHIKDLFGRGRGVKRG